MRHGKAEQMAIDDPSKDVWSANTDELDANHPSNRHSDEEADPRRAYGQVSQEDDNDDQRRLLQRPSSSTSNPFRDTHSSDGEAHPGRPLSFSSSTNLSIASPPSYHTNAPPTINIASPTGYVAPSALSPSDYEETPGGRVSFPQGNDGVDFRSR